MAMRRQIKEKNTEPRCGAVSAGVVCRSWSAAAGSYGRCVVLRGSQCAVM